MVAAEPADLPFHPALLVRALDARHAVEGIQAPVGAERGPPIGLHPGTAEPDHLRDCGLEVVIADLPGRHPAQDAERVLVALKERLLPARQRDPVHRLARERQPQAEQEALDVLPGQPDHGLAEIDFRLVARAMRLPHEHLSRATAGLRPDLRLALGDIRPDHGIGHIRHPVLTGQPVPDPRDGMPLPARRVQVCLQDLVDRRLERVQLLGPGRQLPPRLRPRTTTP